MSSFNHFLCERGLSFDDVLLIPRYSDIESRLHPDISVSIGNTNDYMSLSVPIISSPMDTVTGHKMAIELGSRGSVGIVHRFMSKEDHLKELENVCSSREKFGKHFPLVVAIGVGKGEKVRFKYLFSQLGKEINWIAIDIANGFSSLMKEMIHFVREYTSLPILAGNVATGEGFCFLAEAGANAIRVGIGGGSICKTRLMTGFGVPTLASVADCYSARESLSNPLSKVSIIADGGIRFPSDLVKSLAAGADSIMVGGIFAGTIEAPGDTLNINGREMKIYRGMASKEVQDDRKGGLRPGTCAEGVSTYVPVKGKAYYVLEEFSGGLRSAMTYANARTVTELREGAKFIEITRAGLEESHAFGTNK